MLVLIEVYGRDDLTSFFLIRGVSRWWPLQVRLASDSISFDFIFIGLSLLFYGVFSNVS